ncbi:MAG: hypothetical protein KDA60_20795 [Planctomycetales bacterium]|nr:hypothetical protein [Planctomycetales bacterium]
MNMQQRLSLVFGLLLGLCIASVTEGALTLSLEASYAKASPFGLAYDSSSGNLFWQSSSSTIHQMTTSGVDLGAAFDTTNPIGWSALGFNDATGQLVSATNQTIYFFDPITGANQTTLTVADNMVGFVGLQDGLDFDHNEVWVSPDVGNVYRFDASGQSVAGDNGSGTANPVLGGGGGYSGVERVDIGATSYLIVVNDATNPRRLDVRELDGTLIDSFQFANARYEDLAFDGRYLWAADYFGNKIDKYDILSDGGSIFVPPGGGNGAVPEPASVMIWGAIGLVGMAGPLFSKKRKQAR